MDDISFYILILLLTLLPLILMITYATLLYFGIPRKILRYLSRHTRRSRKIEKDIEKLTKELKYDQEEEDTGNIR